MKSFITALCILAILGACLSVTSHYLRETVSEIRTDIPRVHEICNHTDDTLCRLTLIYDYAKSRNVILSLYIEHSKCAELETLLLEMHSAAQSRDTVLYRSALVRLDTLMKDLTENDGVISVSGIF